MGRPRKRPVQINGIDHWLCVRCGECKPPISFQKSSSRPNGLQSNCKECMSDMAAKYRDRPGVRDAIRKQRALPESVKRNKEKDAEWRRLNKDKMVTTAKAWASKNKDRVSARQKYRRDKYPFIGMAKGAIMYAIRRGNIVRPDKCEVCGASSDSVKIEGHHYSYDKNRWLFVTWMCKACHCWTHSKLDEQSKGLFI